MREEETHPGVQTGGGVWGRRGGEEASNQTEGLATIAGSAEKGEEGRIRGLPAPFEESGKGVHPAEAVKRCRRERANSWHRQNKFDRLWPT